MSESNPDALEPSFPKTEKVEIMDEMGDKVGYARIQRMIDGNGWWMFSFIVTGRHREGLGDKLMLDVIARGLPITLEVRADNEPAVNLYRKHGFRVIEEKTGRDSTLYLRMIKDQ